MDGFPWGFWTDGIGLDEHPAEFRARARTLPTPILRLVGEPRDASAASETFALESRDFGGPLWFVYAGNHRQSA